MTISAMQILSETEILAVSGGEAVAKKKLEDDVLTTSAADVPVNGLKILAPPSQDAIRK